MHVAQGFWERGGGSGERKEPSALSPPCGRDLHHTPSVEARPMPNSELLEFRHNGSVSGVGLAFSAEKCSVRVHRIGNPARFGTAQVRPQDLRDVGSDAGSSGKQAWFEVGRKNLIVLALPFSEPRRAWRAAAGVYEKFCGNAGSWVPSSLARGPPSRPPSP
jgi:hypothetical protein